MVTVVCAPAAPVQPCAAAASDQNAIVDPIRERMADLCVVDATRACPPVPGIIAAARPMEQTPFARCGRLVAVETALPDLAAFRPKSAASIGIAQSSGPASPAEASGRRMTICGFARRSATPLSCSRLRLMVTHWRVAPTMWARSAWVKAAPIRMPSASFDAVEVGEMQQQVGQPLGDRARAEHLRQRRIALALEGQALDQPDREVGISMTSARSALPGRCTTLLLLVATPDHR